MMFRNYRIAVVLAVVVATVVTFVFGETNNNNNRNTDDSADGVATTMMQQQQPHPDPNEEDHDGMIYVGRLCHTTGRRLLANESYAIRYIFGSSFENTNDDDDAKERAAADAATKKLKSFGHVETHPLDGGIVPQQVVTVEPFYMDAKLVSNEEFAKFVARTMYRTEAEKFSWSYVLDSMIQYVGSDHPQSFHFEDKEYRTINFETDPVAQYWVAMPHVYWKEPYGQRTRYKPDHPVVHVSHRDAAEYCQWRNNARLPGEREYEAASRYIPPPKERHEPIMDDNGNVIDLKVIPIPDADMDTFIPPRTIYAWGNESHDWTIANQYANLWGPGTFPDSNSATDGYFGTNPVGHYPPNHHGFYDLTGNVWEWMRGGSSKSRIIRGSSFVDSMDGSLNHAATLGARATTHGTTTAGNIGFRCAKSVSKRIEHHWTWHDIDVDGPLSPDEEYIDTHSNNNMNEDEEDEENETGQRKKKKITVKNEQIRTEL